MKPGSDRQPIVTKSIKELADALNSLVAGGHGKCQWWPNLSGRSDCIEIFRETSPGKFEDVVKIISDRDHA